MRKRPDGDLEWYGPTAALKKLVGPDGMILLPNGAKMRLGKGPN
jgi:hypothetical protein